MSNKNLDSSDSESDAILIKDILKYGKTPSKEGSNERKRISPSERKRYHDLSNSSDDEKEQEFHLPPLVKKKREQSYLKSSDCKVIHEPLESNAQECSKTLKQIEREQKKKEKELEKARKQQEKLLKQQEREEKRREVEREKQNKRVAIATKRSAKPGECLKIISVTLSPALLQLSCGGAILAELQKHEIKYDIQSQCHDHMISVWREVTRPDASGKFVTSEQVEDNVLLLLDVTTFINLVDASTTKKSCAGAVSDIEDLESHVSRLKNSLEDRSVTIIVQGIEQFFRNQANKQKRAFKSKVTSEPEKVRRKQADITSSVTRLDVENVRPFISEALVELQLNTDCAIRFVENDQDAAKQVFSFIKAIAEIPFKRDRLVSGFSFHMESGGASQVDKDGGGLARVWRQQVQQFKNVSAEVANTILAVYPSPVLLVKAYRNCSSQKEAELLLQNLEVRRGAGVMATTRRVGKELSRRMHLLMTSQDPTSVLF